jgi:D-3-phosphoglycerate dehydrogenase
MQILHLDSNHPLLADELEKIGFKNHFDLESSKSEVEKKISNYFGIIIRSRISIDKVFLDNCEKLKFIARIGSGTENIDVEHAKSKNIHVISTPEGNSNAVGEHALGMLLSLTNNITSANNEIKNRIWERELNRGFELKGKTIGLIGYGHTGKSFARKLIGLGIKIIYHDLKNIEKDDDTVQVPLGEIKEHSDVISLHVSMTEESKGLINTDFINSCKKPFWLINTSRGNCIITKDLVEGLKSGKILGAGLDVLEYEKKSFEKLSISNNENLNYLKNSKNVIITPHIAGWTFESKIKLAEVAVKKIKKLINIK